jgi:hypothetical protein
VLAAAITCGSAIPHRAQRAVLCGLRQAGEFAREPIDAPGQARAYRATMWGVEYDSGLDEKRLAAVLIQVGRISLRSLLSADSILSAISSRPR